MRHKTVYFAGAVFLLLLGVIVGRACLLSNAEQGEIFERYETANAVFKVRVTARRTYAPYALPGAEYVFESAPVDSDDFRGVLTLKADQAIPIPRQQIRFVNDRVGYIFFSSYYVVTTDSGQTWATWYSESNLPDEKELLKYNISPAIEEVEIRPDGSGKMVLIPFFKKGEKGPNLSTVDYGRHWSIER